MVFGQGLACANPSSLDGSTSYHGCLLWRASPRSDESKSRNALALALEKRVEPPTPSHRIPPQPRPPVRWVPPVVPRWWCGWAFVACRPWVGPSFPTTRVWRGCCGVRDGTIWIIWTIPFGGTAQTRKMGRDRDRDYTIRMLYNLIIQLLLLLRSALHSAFYTIKALKGHAVTCMQLSLFRFF